MLTDYDQNQRAILPACLSDEIKERLQDAMVARGIRSQLKLAKLSGVPQPTISRVLRGGTDQGPELETLRKLAKATGVHLLWLQEGTGPRDVVDGEQLLEQPAVVSTDDYDFAKSGDRLRYALKVRGLRQVNLAEELDISDSAVSQFCKSEAPEGGGRYAHEISEFLGVDKLWLRFGTGEPKFRAQPTRAPVRAAPVEPKGSATASGLSTLQAATLENLAKLMRAGVFTDMDCLELLQELRPSLATLSGE